MVSCIGEIEVAFAVVGHALRRTEQCGQCLAIPVSILRAPGNIPRTIVDDVSACERRHSPVGDLDHAVNALVGKKYLALLVDYYCLGLDELCDGDRALRIHRAPFPLIRLARDECERSARNIDLPDEASEAVRTENDIPLQIDSHSTDLIREYEFPVGRLER